MFTEGTGVKFHFISSSGVFDTKVSTNALVGGYLYFVGDVIHLATGTNTYVTYNDEETAIAAQSAINTHIGLSGTAVHGLGTAATAATTTTIASGGDGLPTAGTVYTALADKADDNEVVKLTGNQSIAGTKTFTTSPVVPQKATAAGNNDTTVATEAQIYGHANATGTAVHGLGTASTYAVGSAAGEIPLVQADGKLLASLMPALAIMDIHVVANQSAMLALTTAQVQQGDIAVREDVNRCFILVNGASPNLLASWQELLTPADGVLAALNTHTGQNGTAVHGLGAASTRGVSATITTGTDLVEVGAVNTALAGKQNNVTGKAIADALQKITTDSQGHVTGSTAVVAGDLPAHTHAYQAQTAAGDNGNVLLGGATAGTFGTSRAIDATTGGTNASTNLITSGAVNAGLALKANLASPGLTGTPTAPTASAGTNTTQIATTAFVTGAISSAGMTWLVD